MTTGQIETPADLIHLALKTSGVIGVGQTPDYEDTNDCFLVLNTMMGQLTRQRYIVYNLVDTACTSTGAQSYTLGPAADFNIPRIDRLEAAYARLLPTENQQPFDYPLSLIQSHEDYAKITLKNLTTFPTSVFYDSGWPTGSVYVWPVPPATIFELHVITKNVLPQFDSLTSSINLPPEYTAMLLWNLTAQIRPLYQLQPDPSVIALAKASLAVLRSSNAQVAELRMPSSLANTSQGMDPTLGNMNGLPWAI